MKAKYMSFVDLILDQPLSGAAVTDSMLFAFNLDNACGVNLDILGDLVGISRLLSFVPDVGTREMNDDEYRVMIRLKIARNVWDGRNETIAGIYRKIFPDMNIAYIDNQDQTITMRVTGNFNWRILDILQKSGYILVPAGVRVNIIPEETDVEIHMYADVVEHGITVIDHVTIDGGGTPPPVVVVRTWGQVKDVLQTWGAVNDKQWGEFVN